MLNTIVSFMWDGSPGVYGRRLLTGKVIDQRTRASGRVEVLVKTDLLNIPKWVAADEVTPMPPPVMEGTSNVYGAHVRVGDVVCKVTGEQYRVLSIAPLGDSIYMEGEWEVADSRAALMDTYQRRSLFELVQVQVYTIQREATKAAEAAAVA